MASSLQVADLVWEVQATGDDTNGGGFSAANSGAAGVHMTPRGPLPLPGNLNARGNSTLNRTVQNLDPRPTITIAAGVSGAIMFGGSYMAIRNLILDGADRTTSRGSAV